jgi:hypothetical protein
VGRSFVGDTLKYVMEGAEATVRIVSVPDLVAR